MGKSLGRPAWEAISHGDSSAVAMRSVAAALKNEFLNVWEVDRWQESMLRLLSVAGKKVSGVAIERFAAATSVDPSWAKRITEEDLASWAVSLYDDLDGPWDAVIIGAPNGGVAHVATAMGVPFLSQHFLSSFNDPTPVDDVQTYQEHGAQLAERILRRNSNLAVINHYDPLHDRFLVKHVNHVRYKLLDLPDIYQAFIHQALKPGGTIIFVDCRYAWPMYFIDERHWFQVGGLGAVAPRDFIKGHHPEIAALQSKSGHRMPGEDGVPGNWGLEGRSAFEMPESEWGTLSPLRDRVVRFAREHGYQFMALEGAHPEYFSELAFRVWRKLLKKEHTEPQGILVETFIQVAPTAVRRASLLPLWIPWNCEDSLDFLRRMRTDFEQPPTLKGKPILWMPLPNFVETFDMGSWDDWLEALDGWDVHPTGMQPHLYPVDPAALFAAQKDVGEWVDAHSAPVEAVASTSLVMDEVRALRRRRF